MRRSRACRSHFASGRSRPHLQRLKLTLFAGRTTMEVVAKMTGCGHLSKPAHNKLRRCCRRPYCRNQHRVLLEVLEDRTLPTLFLVNSLIDGPVNLGDATVTLRDAIEAANTDVAVSPGGSVGHGADEIQFARELRGTIRLVGELAIKSALKITGPGAGVLTVSGNHAAPVFNIDDGTSSEKLVTISGLTIADGTVFGSFSRGGGILNGENLTLQNSIVTGNSAISGTTSPLFDFASGGG